MKKNEHLIKEVYPGSIAEEMGIEPGDVLLRINKQEIGDVFDYRYYIKDDYIEVIRIIYEKRDYMQTLFGDNSGNCN